MDEQSIIDAAVKEAQKKSAESKLAAKCLAHPNEPITFSVDAVVDGIALCDFLDGRKLKFPLSECFDPNEAMIIARRIQALGELGFSAI